MKYRGTVILLSLVLLVLSSQAIANAKITLEVSSEKEMLQMINGKEIKKRVAAKSVEPGNVLFFVLSYRNAGDEKATKVVFNNPIPENVIYVPGSAGGKKSDISFSIDNGKTFNKPALLTYEIADENGKKIKKQASPEQYTHVRWVVEEILPGKRGSLEFQVQVK